MRLARKTLEGTFWTAITFGLGKVLVFISSVILARLLTPAELGLAGLAMIAINYLGFTRDIGVGSALIYRQGDTHHIASIAFWISLTTGFLLFFVALFASPAIAIFFEQPEIEPLIQLLALSFLFDSFGSTHDALLQKELEFKKKLVPDLMTSLSKGITSIGLAYYGWGVWSVVLGQIVGSLSSTISVWLVLPWRPSFSFNFKIAKDLIGYGYQTVLNTLLILLGAEADYLFVGKLLGPSALGYYTVGFKIPEVVILSIGLISRRVVFPTYSKLQDDRPAMSRGFLLSLHFVSLIAFPLGIGLFIVAPYLINVIYTEKWAGSIPVLQILSLFAVIRIIGWDVENICKAIGRPDIVSKTNLFKVILLFPALWWSVIRYGIVGAASAQLIVSIIISCVNLFIAHQLLGIKFMAYVEAVRVAFLSTLVMFFCVELFVAFVSLPDLLSLIAVSVLGATVYLASIWIMGRETILLIRELIGIAPTASG